MEGYLWRVIPSSEICSLLTWNFVAYLERQEIVTIRRGHNPKNIYQDKNVDAGTSAIQV